MADSGLDVDQPNVLEVRGEGATLLVPLDRSAAAFERLEACFDKNSAKPALLTTYCGSSPCWASSTAICAAASVRVQHELVTVLSKDTRQCGADAGRGAGDQRDRAPELRSWFLLAGAFFGDALAQCDAIIG